MACCLALRHMACCLAFLSALHHMACCRAFLSTLHHMACCRAFLSTLRHMACCRAEAGQLLEGRWAEDSHWRGGGQPLEGRRTVTGMTDVPQGHRRDQIIIHQSTRDWIPTGNHQLLIESWLLREGTEPPEAEDLAVGLIHLPLLIVDQLW